MAVVPKFGNQPVEAGVMPAATALLYPLVWSDTGHRLAARQRPDSSSFARQDQVVTL